jgi:hypothetical protein
MIGFTYTQLVQAMQDWPVNSGSNYLGNIPRFVELAELRLVRDLNLEIFDPLDATFTLAAGANIVNKPTNLIALRSLRLAYTTGTTFQAANATAVCASQATYKDPTQITLTANPVNVAIAAQVTVAETADQQGGITVIISGLDNRSSLNAETLITQADRTVAGIIRWSQIQSVTVHSGSLTQTIEVGTAAVSAATLGKSFPIYKRSKDFIDNLSADPAIVGRPRYYAEIDTGTWQVAPAADQSYQAVVHFIQRPQSIVTAGTTWLGQWCGDMLFLASLMEAEMYLKADDRFADLQGDYQAKLQVARLELRNIIRQGDYSPVRAAATEVPE